MSKPVGRKRAFFATRPAVALASARAMAVKKAMADRLINGNYKRILAQSNFGWGQKVMD
jgi:hypothetical protein